MAAIEIALNTVLTLTIRNTRVEIQARVSSPNPRIADAATQVLRHLGSIIEEDATVYLDQQRLK